MDVLLARLRGHALVALLKPYRRVRLSFVAAELQCSEAEAEEIARLKILDGELRGGIDQIRGVICMHAK